MTLTTKAAFAAHANAWIYGKLRRGRPTVGLYR